MTRRVFLGIAALGTALLGRYCMGAQYPKPAPIRHTPVPPDVRVAQEWRQFDQRLTEITLSYLPVPTLAFEMFPAVKHE